MIPLAMQLPENLFKHDECPGHIFSEKTFTKDDLITNMRLCNLCFYVEGATGSFQK
jgi:hypothetical protein